MTGSSTPADVEVELRAALARYPEAYVNLIDAETLQPADPARCGPLGLDPSRLAGSSYEVLALVDPAYHPAMMTQPLRADGGSDTIAVTLLDGRPALGTVFDLRAGHGLFVAMLAVFDHDTALRPVAPATETPAPTVTRYRLDGLGIVTWAEPTSEAMTGVPVEQAVGQPSFDLLHPDDRPDVLGAWAATLVRPDLPRHVRVRASGPGDRWMWVELTFENHLDDPADGTVHVQVVDISREMALLDESEMRRAFFARLAGTLPVGVLQVDTDRRVTFANEEMTGLVGRPDSDDLHAHLSGVVPDDRVALDDAVDRALAGGDDRDLEIELVAEDGERRACSVRVRSVRADDGTVAGALLCLTDQTESVQLRRQLERRATNDALTGLLNRDAILASLADGTGRAPAPAPLAVIFVDLDGFKPINDRYGHAAGDEVLVQVASRIREVVRSGDLTGRFGGDEFVVVCPDSDEAEALAVAGRVVESLHRPVPAAGRLHRVAASAGVAGRVPGIDDSTVLARADAAMYEAKSSGGDTVVRWRPDVVTPAAATAGQVRT